MANSNSQNNPKKSSVRRIKIQTIRKHAHPFTRLLLVVIFILGVFLFGVAAGRGNVHFLHLNRGASNLPSELNYSSVNQVYDLLRQDYDGNLNTTKLLDGIKSGLASATGDPYTEYFDPQAAKSFNSQLAGSFTGIGAELGKDNGNIIIISPLSGSPAEKAGLKPKDIIYQVDGQPTANMNIDSVVQKIRGNPGTTVKLSIVRDGTQFDLTITRAKIDVPSVEHHIDGSVGYMKISQFGNDTSQLANAAALDFQKNGVKAVVLDLRGNPGGYLDSAVQVSSLWLDKGKKIVDERRGSTIISTEYATGNNPLKGLPTVVLIDSGSASASEITAGALHDNKVATLVGATSFGKGSVQQVEELSGGGELKVTIAHWYTPDGKNINKQGIKPDVPVAITDDQIKAGQDPQKDQAYSIVQSKISTQ